MKKLTVLVDMDDVLCNTLETWIQVLNEKYGTEVRFEDCTEWEFDNVFPTLSNNEIYEPLTTQAFWDRVRPIPEARKYIEQLQNDGHDVYVVTASHPQTIGMKYETVLKHFFPSLGFEHVVVCSAKYLIHGDVLIDDNIENISKNVKCNILFDMPHNKNKTKAKSGYVRASNWSEVYKHISRVANTIGGI